MSNIYTYDWVRIGAALGLLLVVFGLLFAIPLAHA
jgi:hypothetical protein